MLKHALLGFINYGVNTGYEIKQAMDKSTGYFWHAKQSQIYTTLKTLEKEGLVESNLEPQEGRPARRAYALTESGHKELQDWVYAPIVELEDNKVPTLLKLFFSAQADREHILAQLRLSKQLHQQRYNHFTSQTKKDIAELVAERPEVAKDAILWDATRLFGEMHEELWLKWLDEVIRMVEENF